MSDDRKEPSSPACLAHEADDTYMGFATREGLLPALVIMVLPFVILALLLKILPPWDDEHAAATKHTA